MESATEIYRRIISVRVERRGKSSPAQWRHYGHVNPTRCNTDRGAPCSEFYSQPRRVARAIWQQMAQIDDCLKRQNPAYSFTDKLFYLAQNENENRVFLFSFFYMFSHPLGVSIYTFGVRKHILHLNSIASLTFFNSFVHQICVLY